MIQEFLEGGNLNVPSDGLLVALDTPEDAVAFGTAVAEMHSADSAWFTERGPGDPLDPALREKFARSEHGAASECSHPVSKLACRLPLLSVGRTAAANSAGVAGSLSLR